MAEGNGLLQQVIDAGRQAQIASVDGVLHIAKQMSKADLVPDPRPTHLRAEAEKPLRGPDKLCLEA